MKTRIALPLGLLAAGALFAADSGLTNSVTDAIAKLKGQAHYRWTATVVLPGMEFTPRPMQGQAEKDGYALVSQEMNDNTLQAVFKGDQTAIKVGDQWQQLSEAEGVGARVGWFLARTRTAAYEAEKLLAQVKALKAGDGGLLSGDLTDAGAKEMLYMGPRRPNAEQAPPALKNVKASVKFWLKDGALAKFESQVKGTVAFGADQEEREVEVIRTVVIQNAGDTPIAIPAEAKKILESK